MSIWIAAPRAKQALYLSPKAAPPGARHKPLFLRWCRPTHSLKDKPSPPERILTARVALGEEIEIALGMGWPALKGPIQARDGKLLADLQGSCRTTTGGFEGEVELEKPFQGNAGIFSGVIHLTFFVLSKEPECERILKARAEQDRRRE